VATSSNNISDKILSSGRDSDPAILVGEDVVTYRQLRKRVQDLAGYLAAYGFVKGDRIGIFSDNSVFFVISYLGIIGAGLCAVPFQVDVSPARFGVIVESTGMRMVLASAKYAKRIESWARASGVDLIADSPGDVENGRRVESIEERISGRGAAGESFEIVDPERELAAIMFTSGSEGEPKGVMVSHRNIECNTRDIISYIGITSDDRVMVVLPFYYCYGISLLHTHLMAGASVVLNNSFMFAEKVLDDIEDKECTGFAGVPSTYQILLRRTTFAKRELPSLKWFQQAGGRLPNPFIREMLEAFPGKTLYLMYGQTEGTARLSFLPPESLDARCGSIGKGLPSTRLEVLKSDGSGIPRGSNEVGQIVAFGDNITLGYWGDPEETARYFKDGGLCTGDLARLDEDGFIFIVDRARDFIKCMGHRVSAKEIEEAIAEIPQVVETAVVGVPHELYGEAIAAFVVTQKSNQLTADEVRKHCVRELPNFKVPQEVRFMPSLPKNVAGKVVKPKLRELIEGSTEPT
jgi:acyl-CoA synthetase (AMP-forming)/AMP-acid ligase II